MKTFYAVTSTFDDRGRVTANLTDSREAESRPKNTRTETPRKDIYVDWFDTRPEALKFVEDARANA